MSWSCLYEGEKTACLQKTATRSDKISHRIQSMHEDETKQHVQIKKMLIGEYAQLVKLLPVYRYKYTARKRSQTGYDRPSDRYTTTKFLTIASQELRRHSGVYDKYILGFVKRRGILAILARKYRFYVRVASTIGILRR